MKQFAGGARVFNVEVVGAGTMPKRLEFRGERVELAL
jgi:hypothetical protein